MMTSNPVGRVRSGNLSDKPAIAVRCHCRSAGSSRMVRTLTIASDCVIVA
jgi:hypothetical protein